jgi:hypothetical protein
MKYKYILPFSFILILQSALYAQNIDEQNGCEQYFPTSYISDGQQYMSLLTGEDAAEFKILFFENTEYRISACSSTPDVELEYNVYDKERNLLFSSQDQGNSPYWNFKFKHTMECFIEAKIAEGGPQSGIALLMIGFKKNE